MNIIESFTTKNPCYRAKRKMTPTGLMLHSVGCEQSDATVFVKQWDRLNAQVAVHAVLDHTGKVYQCLPWDTVAWHCGGSGNYSLVGVEMTEPDFKTPDADAQIKATYDTAVELFAYLCRELDISPDKIIGHYEGYQMGIASNHGDPRKLWGGKYTMDGFRKEVANKLANTL